MNPSDPDDDDNFAEDECTIDFDDEEDTRQQQNPASGTSPGGANVVNGYATLQQRHLMYCQFPGGEDFSKYLADDDDDKRQVPVANNDGPEVLPAATPPRIMTPGVSTTRRYVKRNDQQTIRGTLPSLQQQSSLSPPPPVVQRSPALITDGGTVERRPSSFAVTPPSNAHDVGANISRSKSTGSLRERLSKFLHISTNRSSRRKSNTSGNLHDFTFADSKMAGQLPNSSGSVLETRSDIGAYQQPASSGRHGETWWDIGTLSSNRSVPLSTSSGSSMTGSSVSGRRQKTEKTPAGNKLSRLFQRNRKSQSVPNLESAVDAEDVASTLSGNSIKGARSTGKVITATAVKPDTNNTNPKESASSSAAPPPLPPLRKTSHLLDGGATGRESTPRERSSSKTRLSEFWKKKSSKPSVEPVRPSESNGTVSRRQAEGVSTLRYQRTYDEIPVAF